MLNVHARTAGFLRRSAALFFHDALIVLLDAGRLIALAVRSRRTLAAENLFLQKHMALFRERKAKPRKGR